MPRSLGSLDAFSSPAARAVETFFLRHETEPDAVAAEELSSREHGGGASSHHNHQAVGTASMSASLWPMRGGGDDYSSHVRGAAAEARASAQRAHEHQQQRGESSSGAVKRKLVVDTTLTMRTDDGKWDEERSITYRTVYHEHGPRGKK